MIAERPHPLQLAFRICSAGGPDLYQNLEPFFLWHQDVRDHQVRAGTPRRAGRAGLRFVRKPITFAQFKATMAEVVERAGVAPR